MPIDEQRFNELYTNNYGKLVGYIYAKSHDYDLAQDIVQDVFAKLWGNRERYDAIVPAFLYTAATNKLRDYYSSKAAGNTPITDEMAATLGGNEFEDWSAEKMDAVEKLKRLTPEQRQRIIDYSIGVGGNDDKARVAATRIRKKLRGMDNPHGRNSSNGWYTKLNTSQKTAISASSLLIAYTATIKSRPWIDEHIGKWAVPFVMIASVAVYAWYGWFMYNHQNDKAAEAEATAFLTWSPIPPPPGIP